MKEDSSFSPKTEESPQGQNAAPSDEHSEDLARAIADARDWVPELGKGDPVEAYVDPSQLALLIAAAESHLAVRKPPAALALAALLDLAYAAWCAMDDGEEVESGNVIITKDNVAALCAAFDRLDALPDDQPGYTMGPAAKARWALRGLGISQEE